MITQTHKRLGCAILALLLFCMCGCSMIQQSMQEAKSKTEQINGLLEQFMVCVERGDAQGAAALASNPAQMLRDFAGIAAAWPAHGADEYKLMGTSINVTMPLSEGIQSDLVSYYRVRSGGEDYQVALVTESFHPENGIVSISAVRVQDLKDAGIEPEGSVFPTAKITVLQWLLLAFWSISILFCLFTIVDILRKKPRLYILWILLTLVFVGFRWSMGPTNFSMSIKFGLLRLTKWLKYADHRSILQISFPFGAILYWCLRNTLLKKKVQYAVPAVQLPQGRQKQ